MHRYGPICLLRRAPFIGRVAAKAAGRAACTAIKTRGEGGGRGSVPISRGRGTREKRR